MLISNTNLLRYSMWVHTEMISIFITLNLLKIELIVLVGQRLPGDEFPEESNTRVTETTHVGPLRRDSLQAISNLTYLIEQSPRDKPLHRSTGRKQLDIPQVMHYIF